jgi:hypothetical protein
MIHPPSPQFSANPAIFDTRPLQVIQNSISFRRSKMLGIFVRGPVMAIA